MKSIALAATVALALGGCASTMSGGEEDHASHHPQEAGAAAPSPERVDMHMKTMQDMHQKMMAAKTPEERQALMAEHMKAMQGDMSMMCQMGSGGGMGMGMQGDGAAHQPPDTAGAPSAERLDMQMKTMQDMHQKMMAAKTPEERQALMAEHMKAMEGGMTMMCEMGSRGGMGMQGSAGSNDMMKRCMSMKDTTMQMMMDRESGRPPATK
ncbi:MAG: hypothetical protein ACM3N6_10195 [Betaproteobacteria bacterium]